MGPLPPLCLCLSLSLGAPPPPDRWVGEDKLKHFFATFVVTSLSAGAARTAGFDPDRSAQIGAGVGLGVGVWKELRDRGSPAETASVKDLVWDAAGAGAGLAVMRQVR